MSFKEKSLYLPCDDYGETLVIDKICYSNNEVDYDISIQDSYLGNKDTLKMRIKHAFQILFKKPVYYADIFVNEKRMKDFLIKLNDLVLEDEYSGSENQSD